MKPKKADIQIMDLNRHKIGKSDYPERFKVQVLRLSVVRENGDWGFHVIPLIEPKEIGQTIYHGYKGGKDLKIPVGDLLKVFRKDITDDKRDGIWFLFCYMEDRHKGKALLFKEVEEDVKERLMLNTGSDE
jgi:hypothetical protein